MSRNIVIASLLLLTAATARAQVDVSGWGSHDDTTYPSLDVQIGEVPADTLSMISGDDTRYPALGVDSPASRPAAVADGELWGMEGQRSLASAFDDTAYPAAASAASLGSPPKREGVGRGPGIATASRLKPAKPSAAP